MSQLSCFILLRHKRISILMGKSSIKVMEKQWALHQDQPQLTYLWVIMNKNGQNLIMADLLNFTVGMWTIFFVFESEHQALTFLDFLKNQHPNLNFTIEKEHTKQLPFFDILSACSDRLITSVYRKSTFTGLLQNYSSTFYIQERSD